MQILGVLRADPDCLVVRIPGGLQSIPFTELDETVQQKYGFDPKKASAWQRELAKMEADAENSRRVNRLIEEVKGEARTVRFKVAQVAEDGVLADTSEFGRIFIRCATRGVADDESMQALVWPAGTYRYTTVLGASKTIRQFTTSIEEALALAAK